MLRSHFRALARLSSTVGKKKKSVEAEAQLVRRYPAVLPVYGTDFCTNVAASWKCSDIEMFSSARRICWLFFFLTQGMCDTPEGRQLSAQLPKQESGTSGILMPRRFLEDLRSLRRRAGHSSGLSRSAGFHTCGRQRYIGIKYLRKHPLEKITTPADKQLRNQANPLVTEL